MPSRQDSSGVTHYVRNSDAVGGSSNALPQKDLKVELILPKKTQSISVHVENPEPTFTLVLKFVDDKALVPEGCTGSTLPSDTVDTESDKSSVTFGHTPTPPAKRRRFDTTMEDYDYEAEV